MRALDRQRPFLGRQSEVYTRLQPGEIVVTGPMFEAYIQRATTTGAPIAFAEKVEPVLVSTTNIGVLKGAAHPYVVCLFMAFMVRPEAQQLWDKFSGMTSALVPGTKTHKFLHASKQYSWGRIRIWLKDFPMSTARYADLAGSSTKSLVFS